MANAHFVRQLENDESLGKLKKTSKKEAKIIDELLKNPDLFTQKGRINKSAMMRKFKMTASQINVLLEKWKQILLEDEDKNGE